MHSSVWQHALSWNGDWFKCFRGMRRHGRNLGATIEGFWSFHSSSEKQHGMMKEKFARRQDLNFSS